jgi:glycerol-3-phosphate dehydrogenase (NAD(P)+)
MPVLIPPECLLLKPRMKSHPPTLCILGAGSWATALAKIFSENGIHIRWWFHREENAVHFEKYAQNPRYLSDVDFRGRQIKAFSSLQEAVSGSDWILVAIPSAFVSGVLKDIPTSLIRDKKFISSVKGILPREGILVTDFLNRRLGVPLQDMAVIGGPCHAEEVALEKQSYLTIASASMEFATQLQACMQSRFIAVSLSDDPEGIEWAAVLKNVYAMACGICHGLGYGDNFQAVLVSNSIQEMDFFLKQQSGRERPVLASAYLGDLLVTAYSVFSRNRTFGNMVGRGYGIRAAQVELGMIAEGYYAVKALHRLTAKKKISLPIAGALYGILYGKAPVRETMETIRKHLT